MCQKEIGKGEIVICEARKQHDALIAKMMRGPGSSEFAMHEAERTYGLPYWSQWNLRHKKRATFEFMARVRLAYLDMLARSVKRDLDILKIEHAKDANDAAVTDLMAEAEALLERIEERGE